jgi:hypothetical protein
LNKCRYIVAIALLSIVINSCSKKNRIAGIINNTIDITCAADGKKEWVITDDSTYKKTFLATAANCTLPIIDFANYTLLGVYSQGGCKVSYKREVIKFENELRYHYKVTVYSRGFCKSAAISNNWITVPKLPSGWTVSFEVINK